MTHTYTEDPNFTDGRCTCGKPQHSISHPHDFRRHPEAVPAGSATRCLCGKPFTDAQHPKPEPVA